MGHEQMANRRPFRLVAAALSRQQSEWGPGYRERTPANQQFADRRSQDCRKLPAPKQQLPGRTVPAIKDQVRATGRNQGHGRKARSHPPSVPIAVCLNRGVQPILPYQNCIKRPSETGIGVVRRAKSRFPRLLERLKSRKRNGRFGRELHAPVQRAANARDGGLRRSARFGPTFLCLYTFRQAPYGFVIPFQQTTWLASLPAFQWRNRLPCA